MGAWSHEPFGNDTACDWSYDLLEKKNLSPIEQAIDAVLEEADDPDADVGSEALAAIEVLAKLLGRGTQTDSYTEDIDAWVASAADVKPGAELLQKAQLAIDKILGPDSELQELWEEAEDGELWRASVLQLRGLMSV